MSVTGKRIHERRVALGMSVDTLAEKLGKNRATVYRYENEDIASIPIQLIGPLSDILRVSPAYLMGWADIDQQRTTSKAVRVPVLGTIPAGIPIEAIEDIEDYEEIPADWTAGGQEYIALRVSGNSMSPEYLDGDVLILRKQECCESGQDCAVMVNGDDAVFKRVRLTEKGMMLMPINPQYDPIMYSPEEIESLPVRIIGVVVELRRTIRK